MTADYSARTSVTSQRQRGLFSLIAILPSEGVRRENLKQIFLLGSSEQALPVYDIEERDAVSTRFTTASSQRRCVLRPGYVVLAKEKATIRALAFRAARFVSHCRAFAGDTGLIRKLLCPPIRGGKKWPASKRIYASVQLRAFCRLKYLRIFNKLMDILPTSLTCRG